MTALNPLRATTHGTPALLAARLAELAVGALVDEAMLTPKPGLVDMRGNGTHIDLTWLLMCRSAHALRPALHQMALAGQAMRQQEQLRAHIGALGRDAERSMMQATGGVNTHRGAIWALGLLVTAAAQPGAAGCAQVAARAGTLARLADPGAPRRTGNMLALRSLEADMRARAVSPGGAADLLAAALLLDRIEQERVLDVESNHGTTAV
jgi:triphosphoribosyl-dephospho-CoA synthase